MEKRPRTPPWGADASGEAARQFNDLRATDLYCAKCRCLRPVRERLLLVLPHGELHAYRCTVCGETLGTREVKSLSGNVLVP